MQKKQSLNLPTGYGYAYMTKQNSIDTKINQEFMDIFNEMSYDQTVETKVFNMGKIKSKVAFPSIDGHRGGGTSLQSPQHIPKIFQNRNFR